MQPSLEVRRVLIYRGIRDNAVGTEARLRAERAGAQKCCGPPSASRGSFLAVKWPGREVDVSPPSSAEGKNGQSYISTPALCRHGVDGDNFTLSPEGSRRLRLPTHYPPLPTSRYSSYSCLLETE